MNIEAILAPLKRIYAHLCIFMLSIHSIFKINSKDNKTDVIFLACVEGEVWNDDCNRCHCSNGVPACTRMRCEPDKPKNNKPSNYGKHFLLTATTNHF